VHNNLVEVLQPQENKSELKCMWFLFGKIPTLLAVPLRYPGVDLLIMIMENTRRMTTVVCYFYYPILLNCAKFIQLCSWFCDIEQDNKDYGYIEKIEEDNYD
jgi:hypothetical protein